MIIRELSQEECLVALAKVRLARLACAFENQPYVVPVYLSYDEATRSLYGFTTPGQKIDWMRANPLVCVEVDEVAAYDTWTSIIVFGRYEELSDGPESDGTGPKAPDRPMHVGKFIGPWSDESRPREYQGEGSYSERERAWQILKSQPFWWEPGSLSRAVRTHRDSSEPGEPVESVEPFTSIYYKIRIGEMTGHQTTRDVGNETSIAEPAPHAGTWDWLRTTLGQVVNGGSKEVQ